MKVFINSIIHYLTYSFSNYFAPFDYIFSLSLSLYVAMNVTKNIHMCQLNFSAGFQQLEQLSSNTNSINLTSSITKSYLCRMQKAVTNQNKQFIKVKTSVYKHICVCCCCEFNYSLNICCSIHPARSFAYTVVYISIMMQTVVNINNVI